MKTKLVAVFALTLIAVTVYATFISPPYSKSKPPNMPLPVAYECAIKFLGADTNRFHCVSAEITTIFSAEGECYFKFYTTNSNAMPKLIAVKFNGTVVDDNGLR